MRKCCACVVRVFCVARAHMKGASVADVAHAKGASRVLKVSSETKSKSIAGASKTSGAVRLLGRVMDRTVFA